MNNFNQEKTAEEQLAELKADRWDSMFYPGHPAFEITERAFRRGFVHALNEMAYYAEDVPAEVRAWIHANREACQQWRDDFRFGRASETTVAPPPSILPYRKEIIHETEYCPGQNKAPTGESSFEFCVSEEGWQEGFVPVNRLSRQVDLGDDLFDIFRREISHLDIFGLIPALLDDIQFRRVGWQSFKHKPIGVLTFVPRL
jgi:hypothetical protein